MNTILGSHIKMTLQRIHGSDRLLFIGDGSDLNYDSIKKAAKV